jgi:hypothetical protein
VRVISGGGEGVVKPVGQRAREAGREGIIGGSVKPVGRRAREAGR